MDNRLIILHLSLIDGIGPAFIKYILDRKPSSFELSNLYSCSSSDLIKIFKFPEKIAHLIVKGLSDKNKLDNELNLIQKNNISWITFIDNDYPFLLKNIDYPPAILYLQGSNLDDNNKNIAVIGSRKANNYGQKVIDILVKPLIQNNWVIVSGGAIGADTMAHQAALNNNGKTIAVLGSGLLKPYPFSNKKLFQKIIEFDGTIVSSFPLTYEALPANFPARNRIISGLSKGCIVVQAAIKSGTRITALHALEQGREVFAIPGNINDELSSGCNKLIQEGAKLILNVQDIFHEFGESTKNPESLENDNLNIFQSKSNDKLLTIDDKIISICKSPISIDELLESTNLNLNELQNKLFELQLSGKIEQNFAGLWQKL